MKSPVANDRRIFRSRDGKCDFIRAATRRSNLATRSYSAVYGVFPAASMEPFGESHIKHGQADVSDDQSPGADKRHHPHPKPIKSSHRCAIAAALPFLPQIEIPWTSRAKCEVLMRNLLWNARSSHWQRFWCELCRPGDGMARFFDQTGLKRCRRWLGDGFAQGKNCSGVIPDEPVDA